MTILLNKFIISALSIPNVLVGGALNIHHNINDSKLNDSKLNDSNLTTQNLTTQKLIIIKLIIIKLRYTKYKTNILQIQ